MHIIGSAQDCSNSIANALELLQFCTKQLIYLLAFYISTPLTLKGYRMLKFTLNED